MTNAQQVFELAMHLMDETNEATGKADTADTKEYKNRAIPILNVLRVECYPYSDTYEIAEPGKRPVCPEIAEGDFQTPIAMDDGICQGVLPYGLAARLLLGEDDEKASFFQQCYQEKLAQLAQALPTAAGDIEDLYGGIEYGEFGHW